MLEILYQFEILGGSSLGYRLWNHCRYIQMVFVESLYSSQKKDYEKTAEEMRAEFKNTIIDQKRKYIDVYLRWREAHKSYQKEESAYKKNLVDYEELTPKKDVVIKYKKTTEDLP